MTGIDLDPVLVLAHSLYTTPDSHVMLLGAGVSMAAGVPTAWDVQMQLIRRVAQMESLELEDDLDAPAHWWQDRYGSEPRYETVVEALGATPVERQRMMREFFEPSDVEREQGLKQPTPAHGSIARLVGMGVLRVIFTLNFDRLMETALRAEGVEPTLAVTPADIAGLAPLQTMRVLVVHLHGDYLSAGSMLNTADEMASYPEDVVTFLGRVLEDRGLVAIGWSARYEPALRQVIRSVPERFTSYWVEPRDFSDEATELATSRRMVKITANADLGLGRLADAVQALRDGRMRHPLTLAEAVSTTKRELAGRDVAIGLHDRIAAESTRLRQLQDLISASESAAGHPDGLPEALARVECATLTLAGLVAAAARWGTEVSDRWWWSEIERFAQRIRGNGGVVGWLRLPNVPALMMLRAAQVAVAAGGRYRLLYKLLTWGVLDHPEGRLKLAINEVYVDADRGPAHLFEVLAPVFVQHLLLGDLAWVEAWETVELLNLAEEAYRRDRDRESPRFSLPKSPRFRAPEPYDEQRGPAAPPAAAFITERWLESNDLTDRDELLPFAQSIVRVTGSEHIRVEVVGGSSYAPVVGHRLARDAAELAALAEAGFCGGSSSTLSYILEAVNLVIAVQGENVAFGSMSSTGGIVPTYLWLDTGQRPEV